MDGKERQENRHETRSAGVWRFGQGVLNETTLTLETGNTKTTLDRSAYQILRALLLHAGEVVTKDELLHAGWPGRVVLDNSLVKAISRLRKALGPTGEVLCSVHGYGYRIALQARYEPAAPDAMRKADPTAFHMAGWRVSRMLAKSPDLAVLLAEREDGSSDARAFKQAHSPIGLRSLKREVALHGYIQRARPELPGLLPLLDWNLTEPPFWVCTPYCSEGNLSQWRADVGNIASLPLEQRLRMFAGLCRTVAELHGLGVLHKDIKPQNLYPVEDGDGFKLLLGDLGISGGDLPPGIAASGLALGEATLHETAALSGTALYIAPEILVGHTPTTRSDLYALGVLLFQMITGDLRKSLAPGWEEQVPDELLRADIAWAAHNDPEKRLGDAALLAERLDNLDQRHCAIRERAEERKMMVLQSESAERNARKIRSLTVSIFGLTIILFATAWMYFQKQAAENEATAAAARIADEQRASSEVLAFLTKDILGRGNPFADSPRAQTMQQALDEAALHIDTRFENSPRTLSEIHGTLGTAYEGLNQYSKATQHFRKQLAAITRIRPEEPASVAKTRSALCRNSLYADAPTASRDICLRALDYNLSRSLDTDELQTFLALSDMQIGKYRNAVSRLAPRLERIKIRDNELYGFAAWFYGLANLRLGHTGEAESRFAEMVEIGQKKNVQSMLQAWWLTDLGRAMLINGRISQGNKTLSEASTMFLSVAGPEHPHRHVPEIHIAWNELNQGNLSSAASHARSIYDDMEKTVGIDLWTINSALILLEAEARLGNREAAEALLEKLVKSYTHYAEAKAVDIQLSMLGSFFRANLSLGEIARAEVNLNEAYLLLDVNPKENPMAAIGLACMQGALVMAQGSRDSGMHKLDTCAASFGRLMPRGNFYEKHVDNLRSLGDHAYAESLR